MESPKRYRPNVAAVIVSAKYPFQCQLFIASRSDIVDVWQFPQGGIDEGETPREALYRELEEEIGTGDVEIIAEYPEWLQYDFPQKIAQKMYPFDGQSQKYFLVRLKKDAKINLATKEPEFCDFKFVSLEEVFEFITYFKRPVYKQVLEYFKKEGYL
ncbi:RNA pyrophosphohydrolase [Sulfurospirillum oryzae]|uniref:RNA pyrophosphohydrolase n=1 Tax=Sulfurospirillum oryzae TaxID=2976535 RepID=UPI0021E7A788|nr:RNA pyrophosphohydrolase [Sulfurospirillum oryzae]